MMENKNDGKESVYFPTSEDTSGLWWNLEAVLAIPWSVPHRCINVKKWVQQGEATCSKAHR